MKKYIMTESQVKRIVENLVSESWDKGVKKPVNKKKPTTK